MLVRFCAYLRIKPHAHYLWGPRQFMSFNLAVYPWQCVYRFRCDTENKFPTSNTHRLRHGLRGYLTFRYPCFRSSVSVMIQKLPSHRYSFNIYEFHLYTRNSAFLYHTLAEKLMAVPELSSGISPPTFSTTYELFKPSIPNTLVPSYYRGCWQKVSRPSYSVQHFFPNEGFTTKGLLHSRGIAA